MSRTIARRGVAPRTRKGPSRTWQVIRVVLLLGALVVLFAVGTVAGIVASYSQNLPDINRIADYQPERATLVYARDGSQLADLYTQNRTWVSIDKIPIVVRNAFIATEDQHFYTHHGVDPGGIVRAAWADWHHEAFQGASTITQQLARRLFLSNEVSLSRKVQEALLAIEIERYFTKDEILERYLNLIYFGAGAYGVQAAAHTYFGTDVGNLNAGQAALLAGLPAAPSDYSPYVSLGHARERQAHVLDRMAAAGFLTQPEADRWKTAPLGSCRNARRGSRRIAIRTSPPTSCTNSRTRSARRRCSRAACKCTRRSIRTATARAGCGRLGRADLARRGHPRTPDGAGRDPPEDRRDRRDGRRRRRMVVEQPI